MCCVQTRGMVQNLLEQAVPPTADEHHDPDHAPLASDESVDEFVEESDDASETFGDGKDPEYVPIAADEESAEESENVSDGASESPSAERDPDYIPLDEDAESCDEVAVHHPCGSLCGCQKALR